MDRSKKRQAIIELAKREKAKRINENRWSIDAPSIFQPLAMTASSILAEPVSGLVGLVGTPFGSEVATNAINRTRDALTYQPTDAGAIHNLQKIGYNLEPVIDAAQNLSKVPGDYVFEKTGSPLLATAAYSAIPAFLETLGAKGASKIPGKRYEMGDISSYTKTPGAKERGIFAGIKAKDADLDKLEKARSMQDAGLSRDEIWTQTGWFQDVDGNWKFEIDDSERFFTPRSRPEGPLVEKAQSELNAADESLRKFVSETKDKYKTADAQTKELLKEQLSFLRKKKEQKAEYLEAVKKGQYEVTLGGAIDSEVMYQYPHLRNLPLDQKEMPLEYGGGYDPKEGIMVNVGRQIDDQESTLFHEMQHAIQEKEGFAGGGSDSEFKPLIDGLDSEIQTQETLLQGYRNDIKTWPTYKKLRQDIEDAAKNGDVDAVKSIQSEIIDLNDQHPYIKNALKKIHNLQERKKALGGDSYEAYRRMAGEVEARNVQSRLNMTPEDRKATPPWKTLDIDETEVFSSY